MEALTAEMSELQDKHGKESSSDESDDETELVAETQLRREKTAVEEVEGLICLMADCDEVTSHLNTTHTEHCDESSSSSVDISDSNMLMGCLALKKEVRRLVD